MKPGFPKGFDKEVAYVAYYIAGHHNRREPFQSVETSRSTRRSQSIEPLGYPDDWADIPTFRKAVRQFRDDTYEIRESDHYKRHLAQVEASSEEPITGEASGEDPTTADESPATIMDQAMQEAFQRMIDNAISTTRKEGAAEHKKTAAQIEALSQQVAQLTTHMRQGEKEGPQGPPGEQGPPGVSAENASVRWVAGEIPYFDPSLDKSYGEGDMVGMGKDTYFA